jgi:photosystem II stability/assembly factor-like uncharacterized protein
MTTRLHPSYALLAACLLLVGQGCIQITGSGGGANTSGGVFRSIDHGSTWLQKSSVASVGAPRNFSGLNVTTMALDPSDRKAIYAGTEGGLFYSYDGGDSWQGANSLGGVNITSLAVSPSDKCIIFAGTGNKVMRSDDCTRTWTNVYFDPRPATTVTSVKIDSFNSANVYAATSQGDLLKSGDSGASWSPIHRFDNEVRQVLMTAADSRVIYVMTGSAGIWKTTDAGTSWTDLTHGLGDFAGALDNMMAVEDVARGGSLIVASNYGLLRTKDGGATWTPIALLTPPGSTRIYSLAISPKNSNFIAYGTQSTLYRTVDGGSKWTTSRLPTARAATTLMIDPADEGILYMGTTLFKQKSGF